MQAVYDQIWADHWPQLKAGRVEVDPALLDRERDDRVGLTLIFRPTGAALESLLDVCRQIDAVEPGQYLYRAAQIHTTVLSIVSCRSGFGLNGEDLAAYVEIIARVLRRFRSFRIEYRGVAATVQCALIQGFALDQQLQQVRDGLRESFMDSGLPHSIDQRYPIATAHCTIQRFVKPLESPASYCHFLKQRRHCKIGEFSVGEFSLVLNDWFHSADRVIELERFLLPAAE
ncbi:MAG: 2'-5' RNA ligase family protein [Woeseiaceae bacterium]